MIIRSIEDAEKLGDVFPNFSYIKEEIAFAALYLEEISSDLEYIVESNESELSRDSLIILVSLVRKCIGHLQKDLNQTKKYIPDLKCWNEFDVKFYEWLDSLDIKDFIKTEGVT